MKKIFIYINVLFLCSCGWGHISEEIIGYNEEGKTMVRICESRGNLVNPQAFGSSCRIELRDYGRITKSAETVNIISNDKR